MRFDFALLADAAQVIEGKLYIQGGGLTRMTLPSLPWMQSLALCMRLNPDEADDLSRDWNFGIAVVGPGETLAEHHTPITLDRPNAIRTEGEPVSILIAFTLNGLVVRQPGLHHVRLSLGEAETEIPFVVLAGTSSIA